MSLKARKVAVLTGVVLLSPAAASANIGIPMIALYLPPAWFALLPIILIEAAYGVRHLKIPLRRALLAQAAANSVSTLLGIPVAWILIVLAQVFVLGDLVRIAPWLANLPQLMTPIISAAWLLPGDEKIPWMIPVAILVLTVLFYGMSVALEDVVVRRFFPELPAASVRDWVVGANGLSYGFLLTLVLAAWFLPQAAKPAFTLLEPVSDQIVDVTMRFLKFADPEASHEAKPPLIEAVSKGDLPRIRKLIAKGERVNQTDNYGMTPLKVAASKSNDAAVRLLLSAGADARVRTGIFYSTALHEAARWGTLRTVQLLLAAGADVNAEDEGGETPLMYAALGNSPAVVEALLAAGADVNVRTPLGDTALKEARDPRIAERLVRAGAIDFH